MSMLVYIDLASIVKRRRQRLGGSCSRLSRVAFRVAELFV
jgi:hypothetical protein